jgi:predicted TPR repeat methyltransferase
MEDLYTGDDYLHATGGTWHAEDAPWKAGQVLAMLDRHELFPRRVIEVGCGSGVVLDRIAGHPRFADSEMQGFDVSARAIEIAGDLEPRSNLSFAHGDPLDGSANSYDLLLALDVFEHVPDYLGFLERCARLSTYKLYHVPLDLYVSSVMRNAFIANRSAVGHLHYFTAETALATLADTGHEVIDVAYTDPLISLKREGRSWKRRLGNVPRRVFSRIDQPLTARIFGGYSLLVLTR